MFGEGFLVWVVFVCSFIALWGFLWMSVWFGFALRVDCGLSLDVWFGFVD